MSEDEEDYGEYQYVRAGASAEGARTSVWDEGWGEEEDIVRKEWDALEGTT